MTTPTTSIRTYSTARIASSRPATRRIRFTSRATYAYSLASAAAKPAAETGTYSRLALARNIPLHRFEKLRAEAADQQLAPYGAELYLIFAYGKLLPATLFEQPPERTVNLHASLLPELRGASPIQSALLLGALAWRLSSL